MLYIFGRHNTVGWTAMGLTDRKIPFPDDDLTSSYDLLRQLAPLISALPGRRDDVGRPDAEPERPAAEGPRGQLHAGGQVSHAGRKGWHSKTTGPLPPAAAIIIATGPDEYFIAGKGLRITFSPNTPGPPLAGLDLVEEGTFVDGRWVPGRSLAGDDSNEGECVMLDWKGIQHVTVYRYQ